MLRRAAVIFIANFGTPFAFALADSYGASHALQGRCHDYPHVFHFVTGCGCNVKVHRL